MGGNMTEQGTQGFVQGGVGLTLHWGEVPRTDHSTRLDMS